MRTVPVLIAVDLKKEHIDALQTVSDCLLFRQVVSHTPDEVSDALNIFSDTEILYTVTTFSLWQPHWALSWIQIHWAGVDHVPFDAIPPSIHVTTTSGIHAIVLAEHAFALLLALRRRIGRMLDLQSQARWPADPDRRAEFVRPLLRGQTIGILGYGSIGREIARIGQAFGMRVLAFKRSPQQQLDPGFIMPGIGDPEGSIPDSFYGSNALCDFLKECDVLVNTLPSTQETEKLIDKRAFASMKPSALFINVGRGKTVDEEALVDALRNQHLAGAGLDVFSTEPLPISSPLWHLENVIVSPHVGGMFTQYHDFSVTLFRENLARYLMRRVLLNEVNHRRGY